MIICEQCEHYYVCADKQANNGCSGKCPNFKKEQKVVYCKDCKHRDPEDKMCDCGGQERAGCIFEVRDKYFCAFGEKKGGTK